MPCSHRLRYNIKIAEFGLDRVSSYEALTERKRAHWVSITFDFGPVMGNALNGQSQDRAIEAKITEPFRYSGV